MKSTSRLGIVWASVAVAALFCLAAVVSPRTGVAPQMGEPDIAHTSADPPATLAVPDPSKYKVCAFEGRIAVFLTGQAQKPPSPRC